MSQIHQMQTTFVPEQDRVLFRLTTGGRQINEIRLWLTRRYVSLLWQALLNMLKSRQPKQYQEDETAPSAALALEAEHQEQVKQANFETPYQEGNVFPLGEEPILVAKIAIKQGPEQQQILCMHPLNGEGIEMALNDQTLHSFCQLLSQAATKADWNLNLDFAQAKELISKRGLN